MSRTLIGATGLTLTAGVVNPVVALVALAALAAALASAWLLVSWAVSYAASDEADQDARDETSGGDWPAVPAGFGSTHMKADSE